MAYVYRHFRNDSNEIFYIGIGSDKKYKRAHSKRGRNPHWKHIVNKVGFTVEIIESELSWEEACEREKYWIKFYGRKDLKEGCLVNMTIGGDGTFGRICSVETRNKMTGRIVTDEAKAKMSKDRKGITLEMRFGSEQAAIMKQRNKEASTGRKHSEATKDKLREINKNVSCEIRKKISLALTGHIVTTETRIKISKGYKPHKHTAESKRNIGDAHLGLKCLDETKRKIGAANKGRIPSNETKLKLSVAGTGRKHSEETKQKMRESHIGHIVTPETREKISKANNKPHKSKI